MYIERLVFPKQIVNGVHVHFKPEDWGPVMSELTSEEIQKIIFYWHKHPGCAKASSGDEEDTFDVFMPEDTERHHFGFMQTADKTGTGFEYEARIEMRHPIFCSITDVEMFTDEDVDTEDTCKKIIAEKITEGDASAKDQPGINGVTVVEDDEDTPASTLPTMYNGSDDEPDPIFEVSKRSGLITLTASNYFEGWVIELLETAPLLDSYKDLKTNYNGDEVEMVFTPKKKQGKIIFKYLKSMKDDIFYKKASKSIEEEINSTNQFATENDLAKERQKNFEDQNSGAWNEYFGHRGC